MRISFKFHQNLKLNFKQILAFSLYNFSNFYLVIIYLEDLSKKSIDELKSLRVEMQETLTYNRAAFNVIKNQYFLGRNDVLPLGSYIEYIYKERSDEKKVIL